MPEKTPELTRVYRLDSIRLDNTYFTDEGYLVDEPIVTSVGIFEYRNPDGSMRRELRLPEHVFERESLASYEGKPIIITHEAKHVDKDNVEDEIVGTMLSKGYEDNDDVRCRLIIHGIDQVQRSGLRQLSLGYTLKLDETPGEWKGQSYDAIQTDIRINHLALVRDARAGDQARLNMDGQTHYLEGGKTMPGKKKENAMSSEERQKTVSAYNKRRKQRLDEEAGNPASGEEPLRPDSESGLAGNVASPSPDVSVEDRISTVKDRRDRRDQEGDPETPEDAMGVIAQQDEDISELMDIIEELLARKDFDDTAATKVQQDDENGIENGSGNGVTLTVQTDSVDNIVRERLKLIRLGEDLRIDGIEDMEPLAARKAIIIKVNPNMRLDGKSKAYVNAAFEVAADIIKQGSVKDVDYQRKQMSSRFDSIPVQTGKTSAQIARENMMERQKNGGAK